jgi:threonine synthase
MSGLLVSTRDLSRNEVSYTDVLLEGLAPDGGLFVPTEYPQFTYSELEDLKSKTYHDIVFEVKRKLVGDAIPSDELKRLIRNAYTDEKFSVEGEDFVPTREIEEGLYLQNLSLGPTASFKDMALQLLGQEMEYELGRRGEELVILGATSGDTGSSAEAALKGLERIKLFMLSPQEGMSNFQKAQMGALTGGNIFNIGIDGRFDDCQDLVKETKQDPEFSNLGAVNSINWGRISSQIPYYLSGYLQVAEEVGQEVDFVVPTGNFGNILSGYYAKKMGVPIRRLIVATNENNVLAKLIKTGVYEMTPAQVTSSPSMDISKASNYERLVYDIFERNPEMVRKYMTQFNETGRVDLREFGMDESVFAQIGFEQGTSTHEDRLRSIRYINEQGSGVIDPHTADGVTVSLGQKDKDVPMIVLETALAVKFEDTIKEALGFIPEREDRFAGIDLSTVGDSFYHIKPDLEILREYIRENTK